MTLSPVGHWEDWIESRRGVMRARIVFRGGGGDVVLTAGRRGGLFWSRVRRGEVSESAGAEHPSIGVAQAAAVSWATAMCDRLGLLIEDGGAD